MRRHQTLCDRVAMTRPIGKLIDEGHMHVGKTMIEMSRVDVEADIETCGDYLRVFIYVGDEMHFTARLQQIGQMWYVANKKAVVVSSDKPVKIGELKFYEPQAWVNFLVTSMIHLIPQTPYTVRDWRVLAAEGERV